MRGPGGRVRRSEFPTGPSEGKGSQHSKGSEIQESRVRVFEVSTGVQGSTIPSIERVSCSSKGPTCAGARRDIGSKSASSRFPLTAVGPEGSEPLRYFVSLGRRVCGIKLDPQHLRTRRLWCIGNAATVAIRTRPQNLHLSEACAKTPQRALPKAQQLWSGRLGPDSGSRCEGQRLLILCPEAALDFCGHVLFSVGAA